MNEVVWETFSISMINTDKEDNKSSELIKLRTTERFEEELIELVHRYSKHGLEIRLSNSTDTLVSNGESK